MSDKPEEDYERYVVAVSMRIRGEFVVSAIDESRAEDAVQLMLANGDIAQEDLSPVGEVQVDCVGKADDEDEADEDDDGHDEEDGARQGLTTARGHAPYRVSIVSAYTWDLRWKSDKTFGSEQEAYDAIIMAALELGHAVDDKWTRHWVSAEGEHVVDYGDHGWYGVIAGTED